MTRACVRVLFQPRLMIATPPSAPEKGRLGSHTVESTVRYLGSRMESTFCREATTER